MNKDITIVGAGIVGICSALSLVQRGFSVTLLDAEPPAAGASYGNAGVISPWSCVPQSIPGVWRNVPRWLLDPEGPIFIRPGYFPRFLPWALRFIASGRNHRVAPISDAMHALTRPNVSLYRQHLRDTGHQHLVQDSVYLHVYRDAASLDTGQIGWQLRRRHEVPFEVLRGEAVREIEPALSSDYQAAVLIKDQARAIDPGKLGTALFEKAVSMGATYTRCKVEAIQPGSTGGWKLKTSIGQIHGSKLVVAAGAWSARLLAPLGIKLPLEAERGYHLMARDPGITLNNSILDVENMFVCSSMLAGVRCAGTDEFAGLDTPPNYRRAQVFAGLLRKMFPEINVDQVDHWMGTRPSLPDSLPCIDAVKHLPGLLLAFGHSHYGLGMAPATGEIIGELANGETPATDIRPYRLDRF